VTDDPAVPRPPAGRTGCGLQRGRLRPCSRRLSPRTPSRLARSRDRRSLRVVRLPLPGTKTGPQDTGSFDATFDFSAGVVMAGGANARARRRCSRPSPCACAASLARSNETSPRGSPTLSATPRSTAGRVTGAAAGGDRDGRSADPPVGVVRRRTVPTCGTRLRPDRRDGHGGAGRAGAGRAAADGVPELARRCAAHSGEGRSRGPRNRTKGDAAAQVATATVAGGGRREQLEALRYARAALDEFVLRSAPAVAASVTALTGRLADAEADRTGAGGVYRRTGRSSCRPGGRPARRRRRSWVRSDGVVTGSS